jgi:chemotaxis signal transduction protein
MTQIQSGSDNRMPDNRKILISERKSDRISNKKAAILFPRVTDIQSIGYQSIQYPDRISVILEKKMAAKVVQISKIRL